MKKSRKRLPPWLLVPPLAVAVRCLRQTYRVSVRDEAGVLAPDAPWPFISTLWHNRLLLLVDFFPRRIQHRTAALASASRDGEYAAWVLRCFGYTAVRGSSSRGGYHALIEMRQQLEQHRRSMAITLDGPRGPRYEVHPGAVLLAEWTGYPIIPLSLNAPKRWEFRSWDRTQLPKPFARVELVIGKPLFVPPTRDDEQRRAEISRLRDAMLAITDDGRSA